MTAEELRALPMSKLIGMYGAERAGGTPSSSSACFDELIGRVAELVMLAKDKRVAPAARNLVHRITWGHDVEGERRVIETAAELREAREGGR